MRNNVGFKEEILKNKKKHQTQLRYIIKIKYRLCNLLKCGFLNKYEFNLLPKWSVYGSKSNPNILDLNSIVSGERAHRKYIVARSSHPNYALKCCSRQFVPTVHKARMYAAHTVKKCKVLVHKEINRLFNVKRIVF